MFTNGDAKYDLRDIYTYSVTGSGKVILDVDGEVCQRLRGPMRVDMMTVSPRDLFPAAA